MLPSNRRASHAITLIELTGHLRARSCRDTREGISIVIALGPSEIAFKRNTKVNCHEG